ncbi:ubiquinol oxidase subunit II [Sphingomonas aracearum]|uniref:Ubiquinol oxidase polypeptide II n=1 Tax=Sphingomonas aracearum TaxID=2283317 RepID=A0A369VVK4_9SPHN|nr:ubiquinol oxidase subunit II [Sphingomonas aracearum]RDE05675.1 ubiquinol oxidase subunit II [Sphingomonas aracearum]
MREHLFLARPQRLGRAALAGLPLLLAGCQRAVLNPAGDVALQQRDVIYISTALMLLIIVPVMALTVVFAWRYRRGNKEATYDPDFDHSTALELVIWSAPLLIIISLGALTWWSTHLLDPFRPLNRISASQPADPKVKPLRIQVVSLDWKWLFIYPELGVATVNEVALPVNQPVRFDLTSTNMMNTFYAPTLAGMIYTMPGMQSTLHAVLNRPGTFDGFSANYSGAGFSDMHFRLQGLDRAGFDSWVAAARASGRTLDTAGFIALEKPSERVPVIHFGAVEPSLFRRVVERCVEPGKPCMSEIMRHDSHAGGAPFDNRVGAGMPAGRQSVPPHGNKPEGALMKDNDEKGSAPNVTKPRGSEPPGSTQPASPKNRDMSQTTLPPVPGVSGTAAA